MRKGGKNSPERMPGGKRAEKEGMPEKGVEIIDYKFRHKE